MDLVQSYPRQIQARSARHGDVAQVVHHIQAAVAGAISRGLPSEGVTSLFASESLIPEMTSLLENVGANGTTSTTGAESVKPDSVILGGNGNCETERFGGQIVERETR
jgi:hypothetical protein